MGIGIGQGAQSVKFLLTWSQTCSRQGRTSGIPQAKLDDLVVDLHQFDVIFEYYMLGGDQGRANLLVHCMISEIEA